MCCSHHYKALHHVKASNQTRYQYQIQSQSPSFHVTKPYPTRMSPIKHSNDIKAEARVLFRTTCVKSSTDPVPPDLLSHHDKCPHRIRGTRQSIQFSHPTAKTRQTKGPIIACNSSASL